MTRLFGNFQKTLGRQLWSGLLQLVTVVLIARSYGPMGNGLYTIALLLPTMLALLLGLGLGPANIYYIASRKFSLHSVTRTTLRLWSGLSAGGLLLGCATIRFRAQTWFPGVPEYTLWIALGSFIPLLFITLIGSLFQGIQNFSLYNLSLSIQPLLVLCGVAVCYLAGVDSGYLVAAHLFGTVVAALVVAVVLARVLRAGAAEQGPHYGVATALTYGMKSHLGNIVAFVNYRVDLFLVNYFIDPLAAGVYGVAVQIAEKLWLVSQAVSTVLLPRLSEVGDAREKAVTITSVVTRTTLAFTIVLAIVAALAGSYVIAVVFGSEFSGAFLPFLLMLPGIVAGSCVRILSSEISARGRPEVNLYMALLVVAVSVSCNLLLIPRFGLNGAAVSTSIAYVLNLVLRLFMFRRYTGQPLARVLLSDRRDWVRLWNALGFPFRG